MLSNFSVEQSLIKAKSHVKKGELAEAEKLYETILQKFSNNIRAKQGLATLNNHVHKQVIQSPPEELVDQLISLYNQGQFTAVIEQAEALTDRYPGAYIVWNILGASTAKMGMLEKAVNAYKKSILLKPNFAIN